MRGGNKRPLLRAQKHGECGETAQEDVLRPGELAVVGIVCANESTERSDERTVSGVLLIQAASIMK